MIQTLCVVLKHTRIYVKSTVVLFWKLRVDGIGDWATGKKENYQNMYTYTYVKFFKADTIVYNIMSRTCLTPKHAVSGSYFEHSALRRHQDLSDYWDVVQKAISSDQLKITINHFKAIIANFWKFANFGVNNFWKNSIGGGEGVIYFFLLTNLITFRLFFDKKKKRIV